MNKKILTLLAAVLFVSSAFSQASESKFHIGPKAVPSLNWYKPDDVKKLKNEGLNIKFSWGLATEFRLGGMAWISTGFQIDRDGGKLSFPDSVFYVVSKDETLKNKNVTSYFNKIDSVSAKTMIDTTSTNVAYMVKERKYDVRYVTIPIIIKMKTKELGQFTYFFNFGPNISVKTKATATDEVIKYGDNTVVTIKDVDISSDIQLIKAQLAVGAGAEYNIFGSTSLMMCVNYNWGFTNPLKKQSAYLYNADFSATIPSYSAFTQKAAPHNVALTVGLLF